MNFQWILLALLASGMLFGIVAAGRRSMQKNALRLLCVPVAFIITFILQACGCMRLLVDLIANELNASAMLVGFEDSMTFIKAYAGTLLTPVAFVLVFFILLILFRLLHVNLICSYLNKRRMRREKRELREAIEDEKQRVKDSIIESERRAEELEEEYNETGEVPEQTVEDLIYAPYRKLGKRDIDELAKERVKLERKALKKGGFFKESRENKTISLVCGAVSAFMVFGVILMPLFYGVSYLEAAMEGIRDTDSDDSKIYKVATVVDEQILTPFEDSFVNQLYESLALKDLMNYTVRIGGRMTVDGRVIYADDVVKDILTHSVRAASEVMSGKSERKHLKEDLDVILDNPVVVSSLSSVVSMLLEDVDNPEPADDDIVSGIKYDFLDHYKNADKEIISNDLRAISSVVDALVSSGVADTLLGEEDIDISKVLEDEEAVGDILAATAELSVYDKVIPQLFVQMSEILGQSLGVPENDAEAYDVFIKNITEGMADADTAGNIDNDSFNMVNAIAFAAYCEGSGKSVSDCISEGAVGAADFLAYCSHWVSVQNAFMHASEDMSLGYPVISVSGKAYLYDMSADDPCIVLLTDENAQLYEKQTSPVYELIGYLVSVSKTTQYSEDELRVLLAGYTVVATRETDKALAQSLVSRDTFVSKSVTVEKLKAANHFEDWTLEERKQDSRELAAIVTDLMQMVNDLSNSTGEGGSSTDIEALLDEFVVLGRAMDAMGRTTCMNELPPLILSSLVMNDKFGDIMNPLIVDSINNTVQNSGKTYEQVMTGLVSLFKALLA